MFKNVIRLFSKKCKFVFSSVVSFSFTFLVMYSPVFAAAPPKLISGTVSLLSAVSRWLLLIIPVGAGAFLGYQALQKSLTDDQAVIAEKNKLMKNTLIGAAIAMTADGLATLVLSFYS